MLAASSRERPGQKGEAARSRVPRRLSETEPSILGLDYHLDLRTGQHPDDSRDTEASPLSHKPLPFRAQQVTALCGEAEKRGVTLCRIANGMPGRAGD